MENKKEKIEITDEKATGLLKDRQVTPKRVATKFVTRTILYPVSIEYKPGVFTEEIRAFVRQYEYVSPERWGQAVEMEKKYAKLNKEYHDSLKAQGLDINVKEPGNPLKATVIEMK